MSIALIPDSAPFSPEQRAWLNGFLAGWIGLDGSKGSEATIATAEISLDAPAIEAPPAEPEEFPWHDPALPIGDRQALAEGKPLERRLMAAMAQLDCGACGFVCQTYAEAIARGEEPRLTLCSPGGAETSKALKRILKETPPRSLNSKPKGVASSDVASPGGMASRTPTGWSRTNPFPASVLRSVNLNGPASEKRTHHVEIDLGDSGLVYAAGDALGVYPTNCPELVSDVLAALRLSGEEPVAASGGNIALREALARDRCLSRPTEEFIAAMAESATDYGESATLRSFLDDDGPIADRDVLDLLREFPSARPDAGTFAAALDELSPRLYSISSSPLRIPRHVHLTVGRVCFKHSGRTRKGVASTMLADRLAPGDEVRVFVQKSHGFAPPSDPSAPMIMIGPGTGIAPFRAFLQERAAVGATGRNWLFTGDRRRSTDFLYEAELLEALRSGLLSRLDLAFSRDSDRKVYVQHLMDESSAEIFRWLEEGASIFVCGDAKRMAVDVDTALHQIVRREAALTQEGARAYLRDLSAAGKYLKDIY